MKHQYTPGTWTVLFSTSTNFASIHVVELNMEPIAILYGKDIGGENHDLSNAQANARLMAAAPDLLEALESMNRMYMVLLEQTGGSDDSIAFDARQAIAKATGGVK